MRPAATLQASN